MATFRGKLVGAGPLPAPAESLGLLAAEKAYEALGADGVERAAPLAADPRHDAAAQLFVRPATAAEGGGAACRACGAAFEAQHEAEWHVLTEHPSAVRALLWFAGRLAAVAEFAGAVGRKGGAY